MADPRKHPKYAAAAKALKETTTPEDVDRHFSLALQIGQDVFLAAWTLAAATEPLSVPALTSAILESAWALAAAHAEDRLVLGERAGIVIGVDERLVCGQEARTSGRIRQSSSTAS